MHDGESFLNLYLDRLGPHASRVTPHAGDVMEKSWPDERRIEFLFNDVAKTWEIWNHLKSTFYSALGPGATVVEQDWAHACTPWLHLWHHRHRDHFEVLGQVPNAGSVAFRLVSPLPSTAFAADQLDDYENSEVVAAFDWAATLVDPSRMPNVRAAYVQLYTLHGDLDRASRLCVGELAASRIDSELVNIALPVLAERLTAASDRAGRASALVEVLDLRAQLEPESLRDKSGAFLVGVPAVDVHTLVVVERVAHIDRRRGHVLVGPELGLASHHRLPEEDGLDPVLLCKVLGQPASSLVHVDRPLPVHHRLGVLRRHGSSSPSPVCVWTDSLAPAGGSTTSLARRTAFWIAECFR